MKQLWDAIQRGYLRLIEPVVDLLVRWKVSPNAITTFGTLCTIVTGGLYATGHFVAGGWLFGVTAAFDVLDGMVARRTGTASIFGAFYDSTLDRVADGAVLGGILYFWASDTAYHSMPMVAVTLAAIIGTFMTSYARARAEALGLDAKVGIMQRPERVTLLAAPQGLLGFALDGWVLRAVVVVLAITAWITVWQRVQFVRRTLAGRTVADAEGHGTAP
jgi:CDP-diacylglycerol--glycerol-3-phosphate 3-phosphatidyltransferase